MEEQAILIDMPLELFWNGEPAIYWKYVSVYKLKEQNKMEECNSIAWLQGLYIQHAILSSLDGKKFKYPTKPLETGYKEKEPTKQEEIQSNLETYKKLKNWSAGLKGNFSKDTK